MEDQMKKLILPLFLILSSVIIGQPLQKGNLVGMHVMSIKLNPGVSIEEFQNFYMNEAVPEIEKIRPGWKFFMVKAKRGEFVDSLGVIIVIDKEESRDKYYNADNSLNELGQENSKKFDPIKERIKEFGSFSSKWTDWLVL